MGERRPRLAVMYDVGSAGPGEIAAGLRPLGEVTFAVRESAFTTPLLPLIAELGEVVHLGDDEDATVRLLRRSAPDAILTFCEHLIPQTARFASALGLPFHSVDTANALTDKWRQRSLLNAQGAGAVRSRRLTTPGQWDDAVSHSGLPAVIKPTKGTGSRNTFKVSDPAQGAELVAALLGSADPRESEIVLEEFLVGRDCTPFGDYVSVESAVRDGEVTHLAVTGKFPLVPPFREVGHFWPAPLTAAELSEVERVAESALRALGAGTGVTHTEIKLTANGPRIIEVNGRMGGLVNHLGDHAVGIDIIEIAGRLALGEKPPAFVLPPGRVTFLYHHPVPPVPCRLEAVHGAADVRRVTGVRSYRPVIRPGRDIDSGVRTHWLDLLIGTAEDHERMLGVLDDVMDALAFTFQLPSGRTRVDARSLRSLTAEMCLGEETGAAHHGA